MNLNEFLEKLVADAKLLRWQEWVSVFFQLASVWFAQKNRILVYPTGMIGVLLASYVYLVISSPPIYADGILQIYFFVMSVLGWVFWAKKNDIQLVFPISYCSKKDWLWGIMLFLITFVLIFCTLEWLLPIFFINFQKSDTVILDAFVSSISITAMWWMAKRKIENWWAWALSNLVAIPLNLYKGFVLFAMMYIVFIVMAILGGMKWMKLIKKQ